MWVLIFGLNAMILALVLKTSFHHIWLLTLILYMKSKDVVSCFVSIAYLLYYSLRRSKRSKREITPKWILSWTSAYCETDEQILKTVRSMCDQDLAPHRQVVCISLDGRPRNFEGHMTSVVDRVRSSYLSWKLVQNEITVMAGLVDSTPVICLEKTYNAGKKDSLILCHDLFSIPREDAPPANKALRREIWSEILPKLMAEPNFAQFDGIFMTDADTTVHPGAVKALTEALAKDEDALAACGVLFAEMTPGADWSLWHLFQQFQVSARSIRMPG